MAPQDNLRSNATENRLRELENAVALNSQSTKELSAYIMEFKESLQFMNTKFEEWSKKMDDILKMKVEFSELKEENRRLHVQFIGLRTQLDDLEITSNAHILEISGVSSQEGETLIPEVLQIGAACNVKLSINDIVSAKRAPTKNEKFRPIVVCFASKASRDALFSAGKKTRISHKEYSRVSQGFLFFNDHISPQKRRVFWRARMLKAEKKLFAVWIAFGKLFVKGAESDKPTRIFSEDDLLRFM